VHVRVAPRDQPRVLSATLILVCAVYAAGSAACRSNPSDQITAEWAIEPLPPVAGSEAVARITLQDRARNPVIGAKLHLEGLMSHPGMKPVVADVIELGGGIYQAPLRLTMEGDWTIVLSGVLRDGARITKQLDLSGVRRAGG
jgi:hypothetical protein